MRQDWQDNRIWSKLPNFSCPAWADIHEIFRERESNFQKYHRVHMYHQVLPPCTWKMRRRVHSVPRHLEDKSLHISQIYYSQIHILKSISCIHILIFAALVCPVHPPCAFGGGWLCLQGAAAQWQGPIFKGSFYPCYLGGFFYQQIFFRTMPSLMRQNLPKRAWRGVRTVTAILPHP